MRDKAYVEISQTGAAHSPGPHLIGKLVLKGTIKLILPNNRKFKDGRLSKTREGKGKNFWNGQLQKGQS